MQFYLQFFIKKTPFIKIYNWFGYKFMSYGKLLLHVWYFKNFGFICHTIKFGMRGLDLATITVHRMLRKFKDWYYD